jgi:hypothetical protein
MKRLTREEIARAAARCGVDPAALRAVCAVESGGSGFLPNGWLKVLFERHWLWRRLRERGIDPEPLGRDRPDLCGSRWEVRWYRGGLREWDRISAVITWASRNDPARWESYKKAAYESCSWGLFQQMGFHYRAAGHPDVYAMKRAFEQGEAAHLEAILRWMAGNGLLEALRQRDWTRFARGYNGSGQVALYSLRLRLAYVRAQVELRISGSGSGDR